MTATWPHDASYLLGGALLTNAVPHLVSGVLRRPFQSPFAKPPGRELSSSTVNVLWGFLNLVLGYLLVLRVGAFDLRASEQAGAVGLGVLLTAVMLSRTFGPAWRRSAARPVTARQSTFRSLQGFNYPVWAAGALVSNVGDVDAVHGPGLACSPTRPMAMRRRSVR